MEDDGVGIPIRKTFVPADNLISALQVERARVVSEQLCVTYNDWLTDVAHFFFSHGLEHHLRTDSRRVAHGDANPRSRAGSARIRRTLRLIIHRSKRSGAPANTLPTCSPGETKIRRRQALRLQRALELALQLCKCILYCA